VLARQVLYYLSHTSSPFFFSYFSDKILQFHPKLASDYDPPSYATCIAGITGENYDA
jgi:hypothetical protein